MFRLKPYLKEKARIVDAALFEILEGETGRVAEAMRYSLMAGGKRLRPVLCLAAGEAVAGAPPPGLIPVACALEMIHTYSLIHDDLPAMDDDALRRGQPTCHKAFDEATAILAGDGLLTLSFEVLSAIPDRYPVDPCMVLRVIRRIAEAAGCRGMIEGQMRDMANEGRGMDRRALERLHGLKTGALIRAAVHAGAVLSGATSRQMDDLEAYARSIGLAFQVADDILNITGDPSRMGKAVGTDGEREKNTFPSLLGLEGSRRAAGELVEEARRSLDGFDGRADPLRAIAAYVIERKR